MLFANKSVAISYVACLNAIRKYVGEIWFGNFTELNTISDLEVPTLRIHLRCDKGNFFFRHNVFQKVIVDFYSNFLDSFYVQFWASRCTFGKAIKLK